MRRPISLIAASRLKLAPILEAELRERAVLLEVPIERAATLLDERTPAGRRFAHALNQDIASALHDAEDPLAPTSGLCAARPFELTAALEASLNTGADYAPDEFSQAHPRLFRIGDREAAVRANFAATDEDQEPRCRAESAALPRELGRPSFGA